MGEIIDAKTTPVVEEETKKTWLDKVKEKGNEALDKAEPYVHKVADNIGWIVPAAIGGFSVLSGLMSILSGNKQREACLVEDDYTGEEVYAKHPLTNDEILAMTQEMRTNGSTKAEALNNLGLLRKERKRKY